MHPQQTSSTLPFALRNHIPTQVEETGILGDPDQKWDWEPIGDLKPEDLAIYATNGNSTTMQSGPTMWDSGEFQ